MYTCKRKTVRSSQELDMDESLLHDACAPRNVLLTSLLLQSFTSKTSLLVNVYYSFQLWELVCLFLCIDTELLHTRHSWYIHHTAHTNKNHTELELGLCKDLENAHLRMFEIFLALAFWGQSSKKNIIKKTVYHDIHLKRNQCLTIIFMYLHFYHTLPAIKKWKQCHLSRFSAIH